MDNEQVVLLRALYDDKVIVLDDTFCIIKENYLSYKFDKIWTESLGITDVELGIIVPSTRITEKVVNINGKVEASYIVDYITVLFKIGKRYYIGIYKINSNVNNIDNYYKSKFHYIDFSCDGDIYIYTNNNSLIFYNEIDSEIYNKLYDDLSVSCNCVIRQLEDNKILLAVFGKNILFLFDSDKHIILGIHPLEDVKIARDGNVIFTRYDKEKLLCEGTIYKVLNNMEEN